MLPSKLYLNVNAPFVPNGMLYWRLFQVEFFFKGAHFPFHSFPPRRIRKSFCNTFRSGSGRDSSNESPVRWRKRLIGHKSINRMTSAHSFSFTKIIEISKPYGSNTLLDSNQCPCARSIKTVPCAGYYFSSFLVFTKKDAVYMN